MMAVANPSASTSSTLAKGTPSNSHQINPPGAGWSNGAVNQPAVSQPVMSNEKRIANLVSGIRKV